MKLKKIKIKKIFMLFMALSFIFPTFWGCDEDFTRGKEVIPYEESCAYEAYNNYIAFNSYAELENFVINDSFFKENYYFVMNLDAFYISTPLRDPPRYLFKYNTKLVDEYFETQLVVTGVLYDNNAPKKRQGCMRLMKDGGNLPWTCSYHYFAYPTKEIDTPLTFKHAVIMASFSGYPTTHHAFIQIFQGEKIIGCFEYIPEKYNDKYYEQFLKDNLIIIGGNLNET